MAPNEESELRKMHNQAKDSLFTQILKIVPLSVGHGGERESLVNVSLSPDSLPVYCKFRRCLGGYANK